MHLPTLAHLPDDEGSAPPGAGAAPSLRTGGAAFRLFHGAIPPTLSIRDQVAVAVAERIIDRRLAPRVRIREAALADQFAVSKAPVNEALLLLQHTGLVDASAHRGMAVAALGPEDLADLVDHRAALARAFVPRFVAGHTREDGDVLRRLLARMAELAPRDGPAHDFVEVADRGLVYLALRAGNRHIGRADCALSLRLLRYFALPARSAPQRRRLLQWWQELAARIAARDPLGALDHVEAGLREWLDDARAALPATA